MRVVMLCAVLVIAQSAASGQELSTAELVRVWDREHLQQPLPPLWRHADVVRSLDHARASAPDLFQAEAIGQSVEGRAITHLWFGHGPLKLLLWSQMHG